MTEDMPIVTAEPLPQPVFPAWLNEAVVLLMQLVKSGYWEKIAQRLKVQREGGYAGIDGFLMLLLYFGTHSKSGLKAFSERVRPHAEKLAALGGRDRLPQQSSMSRLLAAVEPKVVRELGSWLLWEASGAQAILEHSSTWTIDAVGRAWQVFDYDPTKTVLRRRALPEGDDLGPARRRTKGFAKPGYPGAKRGELQVSRGTLQQAGSALWLDALLGPGNGEGRVALASAIAVTVGVCKEIGHPLQRALLRMDGEFGNVPYLSMCLEAGLPALSRLNRPKLLDQPEVRRHLAEGTWYRVPDSRSGPMRSAMDLGVVNVRPGRESRRDDGTPYEPIDIRVVVSRYEREGKAEHGQVIDGWQYELFAAVQMPPDAWPAPDVVTAYFGRGGQENRFAQEDRELELDRILSYNLAGQELASLVGLMVWNMELVHGFHLNPPPAPKGPARPRKLLVDERPVPAGFAPVEDNVEPEPEPKPVEESAAEDLHKALAELLRPLDWSRMLRQREGWSFNDEKITLRCPADAALSVATIILKTGRKRSRIVFRAPAGICRSCPLRSECLSSANPDAIKQTGFAIQRAIGEQARALLPRLHRARRLERSTKAMSVPPSSGLPRRAPVAEPLSVDFNATRTPPGSAEIRVAPFLPAAARKAFRRSLEPLAVRVSVHKAVVESPHPYLATGVEDRQRRRATWAQRLKWMALPMGSTVNVVLHAGAALAPTFSWIAQT
ncbi:MAG: hypothetical protein GXP62_19070 [Oligoflexia bacterium]|nr:hypothetical protein [Oligoflexia bacterium]